MRTAKAITRKAGFPSLCSRAAICYYLSVLIFVYVIATLYMNSASQARRIAVLEREKAEIQNRHDEKDSALASAQKEHQEDHSALAVAQREHQQDHEKVHGEVKKVEELQTELQKREAALRSAQEGQAAVQAALEEAKVAAKKAETEAALAAQQAAEAELAGKQKAAAIAASGGGEQAVAQAADAGAAGEVPVAKPAAAAVAADAGAAGEVPVAKPAAAAVPDDGSKLLGRETHGEADAEKAAAVKAALMWSWEGYKKFAWGFDELMPRQKSGHNWLHQGGTIIDAMSTLAVMGEVEEFKKAAEWVKTSLNFDGMRQHVSFFETTIRVLGGLISAYEFSCDLYACDQGLLDKAHDVGTRLARAFNTPSGLPFASISLASGQGNTPGWTGGAAILAEVATIQLEFGALSRYTGDPSFEQKAMKCFQILARQQKPQGLMPLYVSINNGQFTSNHVSLGAMGDSAFEYLIKTWIQRGRKEEWVKGMYDEASDGILKHLVKTTPSGLMYLAESQSGSVIHKMDHLACFAGGMLVLGAPYSNAPEEHLRVAKGVGETCFQMYARMPTGIAPENVEFGSGDLHAGSVYNIQRPEAVETFFYLWRATKDPIWREHGWAVFQAFEACCKIASGGYVGLRDVRNPHPPQDDTMQTFWLAETLKYLYLLFSDDDTIPLDKYVFNTEAHPLKIWKTDFPPPIALN